MASNPIDISDPEERFRINHAWAMRGYRVQAIRQKTFNKAGRPGKLLELWLHDCDIPKFRKLPGGYPEADMKLRELETYERGARARRYLEAQ